MVAMAEQNSASHLEKLVGKYQPVEEPGMAGLLHEEGPEESRESCSSVAAGSQHYQRRYTNCENALARIPL